MCENRDKNEKEIKWILDNGEVNFWYDNWSILGPLYKVMHFEIRTPDVLVKDVLLNGRWNWNAIQNQLPNQTKLRISNMYLTLNNDEQDLPIWSPTNTGKFTIASA